MELTKEIQEVKALGEKIGYGHLMALSSALWRQSSIERGYPASGAFVATCLPFIKKKYVKMTVDSENVYDGLLKSANK